MSENLRTHARMEMKVGYKNLPHEKVMMSGSSTWSVPKYDWFTEDVLTWVRGAKTEEVAVENLRRALRAYEKRKTTWQKIKAVFVCK